MLFTIILTNAESLKEKKSQKKEMNKLNTLFFPYLIALSHKNQTP
jgi:hypothetical protein